MFSAFARNEKTKPIIASIRTIQTNKQLIIILIYQLRHNSIMQWATIRKCINTNAVITVS